MEFVELMSPHVAFPVIGVVICALMVFAFGFRSPVQPPSFDFEEKKNKRRTKQTKLKGHVGGDNVTSEVASEVGQKSTPKPVKEIKPVPSPKAKSKESKVETRKEVKQEKQDTRGEKKTKARKENVKEEFSIENLKRGKVATAKKETEEEGEWTTIQVTKKGKKQKPVSKREGGRAESAVESENEPEITPVSEAAAASPDHGSEADVPSSPEIIRVRNKAKPGKAPEKNKTEDKSKPTAAPAVHVPVSAASITTQAEDQADGKKKKSKREKKIYGDAAASEHENLPQDAAPASGHVAKKQPSQAAAPSSGQAKKQSSPAVELSSGQAKKQSSSAVEQSSSNVKKQPSAAEVPASEPVVKKGPHSPVKTVSEQELTPPEQAKSGLKKKKATGKENVQKTIEKSTDVQIKSLEKPVEPVKKSEVKLKETISKATISEHAQSCAAPVPEPQKSSPVPVPPAPAGVSFDEIGDSWQEATPKSKKKKSRRDN